jgi:hypothetical protein
LAITAASTEKSGLMRRPNAPPMSGVTFTFTLLLSSFRCSATALCAQSGNCVGDQSSITPFENCAVQFWGSIVAWEMNGSS